MCFFVIKKLFSDMNLCFFYPKLICGPKIIFVSTFVIVWRELAATTQGVDSWHIWETLPGKMCIAPSIMFVQVFVAFFLRQYVNHRIAVIMMRASWFDSDIVRNILRNCSLPRSKIGCPTVHPEWARNARRWLNTVRGHNIGKKTIFKAKKGKNAILAWEAFIRRRLFSCTRFCAFDISFVSQAMLLAYMINQ